MSPRQQLKQVSLRDIFESYGPLSFLAFNDSRVEQLVQFFQRSSDCLPWSADLIATKLRKSVSRLVRDGAKPTAQLHVLS